jgi:hypothetical protein
MVYQAHMHRDFSLACRSAKYTTLSLLYLYGKVNPKATINNNNIIFFMPQRYDERVLLANKKDGIV